MHIFAYKNAVITFITPFGVAQGVNSSIVHCQLTARHLFKSLDDYYFA